jgi:hypothetical protein
VNPERGDFESDHAPPCPSGPGAVGVTIDRGGNSTTSPSCKAESRNRPLGEGEDQDVIPGHEDACTRPGLQADWQV